MEFTCTYIAWNIYCVVKNTGCVVMNNLCINEQSVLICLAMTLDDAVLTSRKTKVVTSGSKPTLGFHTPTDDHSRSPRAVRCCVMIMFICLTCIILFWEFYLFVMLSWPLYVLLSTHSPCNSTPVSMGMPDPGVNEGSSKQLRSFPRSKHKVRVISTHVHDTIYSMYHICINFWGM